MSKLGVVLFGLVALCIPRTANADSITPQEYSHDLAIVITDIAKNPNLYLNSKVAQADFQAGINAGNQALLDLLFGDNTDAQKKFQIALADWDGTLASMGLPLLPGGPYAVPEPSTEVLIGIGVAVAVGMKFRQRKRLRAELSPAS